MTNAQLPPDVQELPTAARWIYRLLERNGGELSISAIREHTGLTVRGIRKAVVDLEESDLATSHWSTDDARERIIRLQ